MSHPAERFIRDVPDFPKPGIVFKDLTPLFLDAAAFHQAMEDLAKGVDWAEVDAIAAIEARGFILGGYLSATKGVGLIPIRKAGKLPSDIVAETYDLEYGSDTVEIHSDACQTAKRILLVDDVLATGGTAAASKRLIEKAGGEVVHIAFLLELEFLSGRRMLDGTPISSLIRIDG